MQESQISLDAQPLRIIEKRLSKCFIRVDEEFEYSLENKQMIRMEKTIRRVRRKMTREMKMRRMRGMRKMRKIRKMRKMRRMRMRMNRMRRNVRRTTRTRRRMRRMQKHMISLAGWLKGDQAESDQKAMDW